MTILVYAVPAAVLIGTVLAICWSESRALVDHLDEPPMAGNDDIGDDIGDDGDCGGEGTAMYTRPETDPW